MRYYAFALTAGIALFQCMPEMPSRYLFLGALPLAGLAIPGRHWRLFAFCGLGFLWAMWRAELFLQDRLSPAQAGRIVRVDGTLTRTPLDFGTGVRIDIDTAAVTDLRGNALTLPHLRLGWYERGMRAQFGDRCRLMVRLALPRGTRNFGGFDREKWLFRERIAATGAVVTHPANVCSGTSAWWSLDRLRHLIATRIRESLATSPHQGVIAALAVADSDGVDDGDWDILRATGTAHLLSISGLHISLVALGAFTLAHWVIGALAPGSRRWPVQRPGAFAGLVAAIAYAGLAGFPVPTQRALVMVAIAMIFLALRRRVLSIDAYAAALATVAVLDPFVLLGAGFWLSFGAVAWLLVINLSREPHSAPARLLRMHVYLALGLTPLLGMLQQSVPMNAPIANLIAVPVVTLAIVPLVIIGVIVLPLDAGWAANLWAAAAQIWGVLWNYLCWLAEIAPPLSLPAAATPLTLVLALLGVIVIVVPVLRARWLFGCALLGALAVGQSSELEPGHVRLTVLDVGQGLAVVVETAAHVLVYDTGPAAGEYSAGAAIVAPYLRASGVASIDRLMLSHGDNDHAGGWPGLARDIAIRAVTVSPGQRRAHNAARCRAGMRWSWDQVDFEVLYPSANARGSDNDLSCVLRIVGAAGAILLPGDIERGAEAQLLEMSPDRLSADVLLAPHHGSNTSSSRRFVAAVSPRYVIFAAAAPNRFAFPRPEVVQTYTDGGAHSYTTGEEGAIEMLLTDVVEKPRSYRRSSTRYWDYPVVPRSDE